MRLTSERGSGVTGGPLDLSPSKGNQGTTRGKEKVILTSLGIEPTTSGLDLLLLSLSDLVAQSAE